MLLYVLNRIIALHHMAIVRQLLAGTVQLTDNFSFRNVLRCARALDVESLLYYNKMEA